MKSEQLLDILGNENRRRILQLLASRPCYVSEISERLDVAPKAVIAHLGILEKAGLVEHTTDRQRRKYFHIADNFHFEVSISPFSFGAKALDVDEEKEFDDEALISAFREFSEMEEFIAQKDLGGLVTAVRKITRVQGELSIAQRHAQKIVTAVTGRCIEVIDELTPDAVQAQILLSVVRGTNDAGAIMEELEIPEDEFRAHLKDMENNKIIKIKKNKIYLGEK